MANNRVANRTNTLFHSKMFDAQSGDLLGYTVDVSDTGIRLMADSALEPGQVLETRLELPQEILGRDSINMKLEVRWCREDTNPDYMAIGLEFVETSRELYAVIKSIQDVFCFGH